MFSQYHNFAKAIMPIAQNRKWYLLIATFFTFVACACHKVDSFLDEKPSSNLVIPKSISDFRALLDNERVMNETPAIGEISADNYFMDFTAYQALPFPWLYNSYIWNSEIYEGTGTNSNWNKPYEQVFYANIVLEGLDDIEALNSSLDDWNDMKGWAHFARANAFFDVAEIFAPAYDSITAANDLGIPLRLNSNVNEVSKRATVKQTYDQILSDLHQANQLLTPSFHIDNRNRPSKVAAMALLAKVYLSMRAYDLALSYADSCLSTYNTLIDYNEVDTVSNTPFPTLNSETILQSNIFRSDGVISRLRSQTAGFSVDTILYNSYNDNDLRKKIYYSLKAGAIYLKSGYSGITYTFSGLATDEVYLIRAECYARKGKLSQAMSDLNTLLRKRYRTGTFVPHSASSVDEALNLVLDERRKELPFRSVRWSDLRRLNKEGRNLAIRRILNGQVYSLEPNSKRYVLPIPPDVISLSDIQQNER